MLPDVTVFFFSCAHCGLVFCSLLYVSQAADLLRSERKENQVRVQYLAERVNELESANRNLLAGEGSTPSEPMEG